MKIWKCRSFSAMRAWPSRTLRVRPKATSSPSTGAGASASWWAYWSLAACPALTWTRPLRCPWPSSEDSPGSKFSSTGPLSTSEPWPQPLPSSASTAVIYSNQTTPAQIASSDLILSSGTEAIHNKTGGSFEMNRDDPGSAGIFSTYPAAYLSTLGGFGDQVGTRTQHTCRRWHTGRNVSR